MTNLVEAHPIVAALAAAIVRDGAQLRFPREAVDRVEKELVTAAPEVAQQLAALGVKARRIAGDQAMPLLIDLYVLITIALGNTEKARDAFAAAGLDSAAAEAVGAREVARPAITPITPAMPTVKARRGLAPK